MNSNGELENYNAVKLVWSTPICFDLEFDQHDMRFVDYFDIYKLQRLMGKYGWKLRGQKLRI